MLSSHTARVTLELLSRHYQLSFLILSSPSVQNSLLCRWLTCKAAMRLCVTSGSPLCYTVLPGRVHWETWITHITHLLPLLCSFWAIKVKVNKYLVLGDELVKNPHNPWAAGGTEQPGSLPSGNHCVCMLHTALSFGETTAANRSVEVSLWLAVEFIP